MEIKDQLRFRMEQLKVPVAELAKRVGVSNQTVRFWLDGRNYPGKRHIPALERALSFKLDFSTGVVEGGVTTAEAMMSQADIDLLLEIKRLPGPARMHLHRAMVEINQDRDRARAHMRDEVRREILQSLAAPMPQEPGAPLLPPPDAIAPPPVIRRRK